MPLLDAANPIGPAQKKNPALKAAGRRDAQTAGGFSCMQCSPSHSQVAICSTRAQHIVCTGMQPTKGLAESLAASNVQGYDQ